MSLKIFLDQENRMASFFKEAPVDINAIDDARAQKLFQRLDSNLSPECLFQDGERPRAAAASLKKIYLAAIADLKAKGFSPKEPMYSI
jgi:hypothetical protein